MGTFKYLSDEDAHNPLNSYLIQHEENKKFLKISQLNLQHDPQLLKN